MILGLPLSHRKKICIKSEKFLSKVSGCEWQTINSTQNEKYYNKSLLRGRVKTTWTKEGEGGCLDDHNTYIITAIL